MALPSCQVTSLRVRNNLVFNLLYLHFALQKFVHELEDPNEIQVRLDLMRGLGFRVPFPLVLEQVGQTHLASVEPPGGLNLPSCEKL
jgi:hypothetical protein